MQNTEQTTVGAVKESLTAEIDQQWSPYKLLCNDIRNDLRCIGDRIKALKDHPICNSIDTCVDNGELKANIMLAFRHAEDARMRLGKSIQATEGGVSCFDK